MKRLILFALFTIVIRESFACDICGCNSGSYFIGPFPQFNRYFAGMRYSFQRFSTVLNSDNTQFSKDFYQSNEVLAGARIRNKWQMLTFVPYQVYNSKSDDGVKQNQGLGDITFIGNFNLLNSKTLNKDTETVSQQFWIGAGIKLPTGKFSIDTGELVSSANMQPGTGSVDFLCNAIYIFQIKSWGFNFNANYKINQNADHFKYGNRLGITSFVFRSFHVEKATISPNIGLLYESSGPNRKDLVTIKDTGGNALLSALGFEFRFKNFALGSNVQIPLSSELSSGQTKAKTRGMCSFSFMF